MYFSSLSIPDLVLVSPKRFGDSRGWFSEIFKDGWFREHIADVSFIQDNQSFSALAGTIRGLHFQLAPFAQGKLVRCIAGAIFDVGVDIRADSPNFGAWAGAELSADNGRQLWIPPGFAHGFMTLVEASQIHYKVTAPYSAANDCGIRFDDPDIAVRWPALPMEPTLSEKDKALPLLKDLTTVF